MATGWGKKTWGADAWGDLSDTSVNLSGLSLTSTIGNETHVIDHQVTLTGLQLTSSTANISTTLSENIDATQDYIPVTSTAGFDPSNTAEIETTNEVVSFTDISQNLIGLTEDITHLNQWWGQVNATVTVNDTTAPDGTSTADKWVPNNLAATCYFFKANGYIDFDANVIDSIPKTVTSSIFVKTAGLTAVRMDQYDDTTGNSSSVFNLSNGTVTSDDTGTAAITAFANDWYRIQQTHTFGSTSSAQTQFGRNTVTGNGTDGLYFWGAQVEEGTTTSTYIPNTTQTTDTMQGLTDVTRGVNGTTAATASSGATVSTTGLITGTSALVSVTGSLESMGVGQVVQGTGQEVAVSGSQLTSTSGTATVDDTTLTGEGWGRDAWGSFAWGDNYSIQLTGLQASATFGGENKVLYSQTYSNAYWTKSASTVTDNATTAPDGTTTASKLNETAATTQFRVLRDSLVSGSAASKTFTWSCFFKKAERTAVRIEIYADTQAVESTAMFNLSNGTVGYTANVDSTAITSQGDDWYRCSLTRTMDATASALRVYHMPATGTSNGDQIYAGNTSNGIYLWGSQLEEGPVASGYNHTIANPYISDVTAFTDVTASVTGQQLTASFSHPSFSIQIDQDIFVLASEDQLDALTTSSTVTADANVSVTGIQATMSIGTAVGGLKTPVDVTGIQATMTLGSITLIQSTNESVTGQQLTMALGQHADIPGQIIGVGGLQLTSSIGSVTAEGTANIDVTGIQLTASVGTLNITAWAEVDPDVSNTWREVDRAA